MTAKRMTFPIIDVDFAQGIEEQLCKINGNDWIMLKLFYIT